MRIGGVNNMKKYKIAVAGTGYVGLSIATLLSQHHHETAVDMLVRLYIEELISESILKLK